MAHGQALYIPKTTMWEIIDAQTGIHRLRNRAIIVLTHFLGLRAIEVSRLRIGDIYDYRAGQIKEHVRLLPLMTKGKKFRELDFIDPDAKRVLSEYLEVRSVRHPESPLFLSQKGGGFSPNTMQRLIGRCYKDTGITAASSHSGRRSFATRLIHGEVNIFNVMTLMGHSSIQTTQRYFETSPELLRKAISVL